MTAYINEKSHDTYISRDIEFSAINRRITRNDLEGFIEKCFPTIYESYRKGKGLALKIIKYLGENEKATIYRLQKDLNINVPAAINILRRLEKQGYVKHRVVEGRGPRGTYYYYLTPLGKLAYITIFEHMPATWVINSLYEAIKGQTIKDKTVLALLIDELLMKNEFLLKNETFLELLNYMFMKYWDNNLEDIIKEEKSLYILFFNLIRPIVLSVYMDLDRQIYYSIKQLPIPGIPEEAFSSQPEKLYDDLFSIIKKLDQSIIRGIASLTLDVNKLQVEYIGELLKFNIMLWGMLTQLFNPSSDKDRKKQLIATIEKRFNRVWEKIQKEIIEYIEKNK